MRRTSLTLAAFLLAFPLQAQLTPEQRAAVERRTNSDLATRSFEASMERRSLGGFSDAYVGPAAGGRYPWRGMYAIRQRLVQSYRPVDDPTASGGSILIVPRVDEVHRGAIGQRQGRPVRLAPLGIGLLSARADIPLKLTIASPYGGPQQGLVIRAAIAAPDAEPTWERTSEIVGDEQGTYQIEVPALPAGRYEVHVDVFYPEEPTLQISTTRTPLVVWRP